MCVKCGVALAGPGPHYTAADQKSKFAAGLLALFLGCFGIHNFYLGYIGKAVAQLLISLLGGLITCGVALAGVAIWAFIEGILILTGSISQDAKGIPLKS